VNDPINENRGMRANVPGLERDLRDDIADANRLKRELDPRCSDSEARDFALDSQIRSDQKQNAGLEAYSRGQRFQTPTVPGEQPMNK
jgi:hypothetical protein